MKHWTLVSQQTLPSEIPKYMGFLFLPETLKQKQICPVSLCHINTAKTLSQPEGKVQQKV